MIAKQRSVLRDGDDFPVSYSQMEDCAIPISSANCFCVKLFFLLLSLNLLPSKYHMFCNNNNILLFTQNRIGQAYYRRSIIETF